jgi:hypothetical protein
MSDVDSKNTYTVRVADNFHYGDSSETYTKGKYDSLDLAIAAAKQIVEDYLRSAYRAGMTAEQLYDSYTSFGEDPFIVGGETADVVFRAWEYAKARSGEICGDPSGV